MIYVTGDMHGDIARLKQKMVKKFKKGDSLIICGDFGFIWDDSKAEKKQLKWLSKRKYTILFVEGTHDNLSLLMQYPIVDYCCGKARQIAANIYQLCRGSIFEIESRKFFAFGGGESEDIDSRAENVTWWPDELPSEEELETAQRNLTAHQNKVDYIITHDCSTTMLRFLDMEKDHSNYLIAFFAQVQKECTFKRWFFGSYHLDKNIPPYFIAVFKEILPLE